MFTYFTLLLTINLQLSIKFECKYIKEKQVNQNVYKIFYDPIQSVQVLFIFIKPHRTGLSKPIIAYPVRASKSDHIQSRPTERYLIQMSNPTQSKPIQKLLEKSNQASPDTVLKFLSPPYWFQFLIWRKSHPNQLWQPADWIWIGYIYGLQVSDVHGDRKIYGQFFEQYFHLQVHYHILY